MRPLSALDASFIYLESYRSPMHIGGIYLLNATDAPPDYDYRTFRAHIESRLPLSRVFRERLVEVPLNLSHPYWINDPEFELDFHLPQIAVPRPGGLAQLMDLAAHIFGRPLNRSRPLWEMYFVDGVDGIPGLAAGSFAIISKIHHASVDGGSGAELMAALLDVTPVPREVRQKDRWRPEKIPGAATMIAKAYARLGGKPMELARFVGEVATGARKLADARKAKPLNPPPLPLTAPRSVLNAAVSAHRTFWAVDIEFSRIRAVKQAVPSATVNDVMLALCAGGLREYLQSRDALPVRPLVAMAPISVRKEQQKGEMGNQVSAMLVNLETREADALTRLTKIVGNTRGSKAYSGALPANRITEFIPSETAALAARLYTRTKLGEKHRPFFNLAITNVPGPPMPLYLAGARVSQHFGTAPIMDGLGLTVVIFSYAGRVSVSLTSCREIVPDPERLGDAIQRSLGELEAAIPQTGSTNDTTQAMLPEPPVSDTLQRLREATQALDESMALLDGKDR